MERYSHDDMAALERDNWWYRSRQRVLEELLRKYVPKQKEGLDLGCGVGSHFGLLHTYADECIGLDIAPKALAYASRRQYAKLVEGSIERIPLSAASVGLVLCTDVLEHVDDDKALEEIKRVLKPGGFLCITVPAFRSLWNENDDYSHHLRRYGSKELRERVVQHGFTIRYFNFWNLTFFVPVWLAARLYKRKEHDMRNNLTRIPSFLDGILWAWMSIENNIGSRVTLPFGVSQVLIAQKL